MEFLPWSESCELIKPHVVRITTPQGSGTGFLLARKEETTTCSIATAAHVIDHAHHWEQLIRIQHFSSGKTITLNDSNRAVFLDEETDSAAVVFDSADLDLPETPLDLSPENKTLKVGFEVGWLGFPAVAPQNLCFFSGRVSVFKHENHAYLVDGVAINGVSGGPAIFNGGKELTLIGVVSAYIPNRATGETLPGLSVIRDVSHLRTTVKLFNTVDDAKKKETPPELVDSEDEGVESQQE